MMKRLLGLALCLLAQGAMAQQTNSQLTLAGLPVTVGTSPLVLIVPSGVTATPVISPAAGTYSSTQTVTITDSTGGATIYYTTDGSTPTTSSAVYSTSLSVSFTQTVNAMALASGYTQSSVASAAYVISSGAAATPTFSPSTGTYSSAQTVTISAATGGSTIYYTTNGSTPTTSSAVYSAPLSVSATTTVKAIAAAFGYTNSAVGSATYTIVASQAATPTFSPGTGSYSSTQTVTISDTTPSSTIYYTTNGTTPTTSSSVYSTPLSIAATATVQAIAMASGYSNSSVGSATYTITTSGETLQFNCSSFTSASGSCQLRFPNSNSVLTGGSTGACNPSYTTSGHTAGACWTPNQYNVTGGFDTTFTFHLAGNITTSGTTNTVTNTGIAASTFTIQNSSSSTQFLSCPSGGGYYGLGATADANMAGFGGYGPPEVSQCPIGASAAIKFDYSMVNGAPQSGGGGGGGYYYRTTQTGIMGIGQYDYFGPQYALSPTLDASGAGLNMYSGHEMQAHVTYDGSSTETLVLTDQTTGAGYRTQWPVNIQTLLNSSSGWFGFTQGIGPNVNATITFDTWSLSLGRYTQLAAPTISPATGSYTSSQTVTISCPGGSTGYYTTNGIVPATSANSTAYTGSFSVASHEIVQAVCLESGYTDSPVTIADLNIQASGPQINFANFTGAGSLMRLNGSAGIVGSYIELTQASGTFTQAGSAWYPSPQPLATIHTTFVLTNISGSGYANGSALCWQNVNTVSTNAISQWSSGGPNAIGNPDGGFGFGFGPSNGGLLNSVCIAFDMFGGNLVGLYQNSSGSEISVGSGVNLQSGTPITISVTYSASTQIFALSMVQGSNTFTHSWTGVNIPSVVGASTAYEGFTGGDGGVTTSQRIGSWTSDPLRPQTLINANARLGKFAGRASNDDYFGEMLKDAI